MFLKFAKIIFSDVIVKDARQCTMCRECVRDEKMASAVLLAREKDHFLFEVRYWYSCFVLFCFVLFCFVLFFFIFFILFYLKKFLIINIQ